MDLDTPSPLSLSASGHLSKSNLDQASYEAFRTGHRRVLKASPPRRHLSDDPHSTTSWQTIEVGYFDGEPMLFNHIENENNVLHFHHVVAFVNHLRALSVFRTEDTLRYNIHACLRGKALEWFISELSQQERESLRTLPLEDGWFRALEQRFKPCALAEKMLDIGFEDDTLVGGSCSSILLAHCLLRHIQVALTGAHPVQWLEELWKKTPLLLQSKMPKPTQITTVLDFMSRLDLLGIQGNYNGGFFEEEDDECDVDDESD